MIECPGCTRFHSPFAVAAAGRNCLLLVPVLWMLLLLLLPPMETVFLANTSSSVFCERVGVEHKYMDFMVHSRY